MNQVPDTDSDLRYDRDLEQLCLELEASVASVPTTEVQESRKQNSP